MKQFRWLSIGAAVFLALSLFAPMNVEAASSQKHQTANSKSLKSSKSSSKKEIRQTRKEVKSGKSAKTSKTAKKTKVAATADNERAVWLKRAKDSELARDKNLLKGKASWYGRDFHNKKTASGVNYDMHTFTAAHRTLPVGTVVKVTDQDNGKSVMVCVTDRGPYVHGRIIDLSYAAAKQLGLKDRGVGKVELEVVSDEKGVPLKSGQAYFIKYASDNGKNKVGPFHAFADATAMHEAISQAHPDAVLVLDNSRK